MRTHLQTGKPVRVVVSRGERGAYCSLCRNGLTAGVDAGAPPLPDSFLFCRTCAVAIGRVAGAIGQRKRASS